MKKPNGKHILFSWTFFSETFCLTPLKNMNSKMTTLTKNEWMDSKSYKLDIVYG